MRISRRSIALSAVVLSLCYLTAFAAAQVPVGGRPGQPVPGFRVALLDVNYIFKNHNRFKGMMEDMKGDVQRAEERVKQESDAIKKLAERLKEFRAGRPTISLWKRNWPSGKPTFPCRSRCRKTSSCNAKPVFITTFTKSCRRQPTSIASETASTWCCASTAIRPTYSGPKPS